MFVKKVFQLDKPFLANSHYTISKKYSYMYSMTPKIRRSCILCGCSRPSILGVLNSFLNLTREPKKINSAVLPQKMALDMAYIGCKLFKTSPPSMEVLTSKRRPIMCSRGYIRGSSPQLGLNQVPNFQEIHLCY